MGFIDNLLNSAVDAEALPVQAKNQLARIITKQDIETNASDYGEGEVILFTLLIDDSLSIDDFIDSMINGINRIFTSILGARESIVRKIQVQTIFLNNGLLSEPRGIKDAVRLNTDNYSLSPNGTPLFDSSFKTLGAVTLKKEEYFKKGINVRTVTVIITDGGDNISTRTASDVSMILSDMLETCEDTILGYGIGDDENFFRDIFSSMGIDNEFIMTSDTDERSMRRIFDTISNSVTGEKL